MLCCSVVLIVIYLQITPKCICFPYCKVWLVCLGASNGTMVDESRLDPFDPKLVYWPTEKGPSHLSMAFGLSLRYGGSHCLTVGLGS